MNTAVLEGLEHYFGELETNNDVRAIIVRGEGKAFCAGLDLRELNARQQSDEDAEIGDYRAARKNRNVSPSDHCHGPR